MTKRMKQLNIPIKMQVGGRTAKATTNNKMNNDFIRIKVNIVIKCILFCISNYK